jgi:hypothetical protein
MTLVAITPECFSITNLLVLALFFGLTTFLAGARLGIAVGLGEMRTLAGF